LFSFIDSFEKVSGIWVPDALYQREISAAEFLRKQLPGAALTPDKFFSSVPIGENKPYKTQYSTTFFHVQSKTEGFRVFLARGRCGETAITAGGGKRNGVGGRIEFYADYRML